MRNKAEIASQSSKLITKRVCGGSPGWTLGGRSPLETRIQTVANADTLQAHQNQHLIRAGHLLFTRIPQCHSGKGNGLCSVTRVIFTCPCTGQQKKCTALKCHEAAISSASAAGVSVVPLGASLAQQLPDVQKWVTWEPLTVTACVRNKDMSSSYPLLIPLRNLRSLCEERSNPLLCHVLYLAPLLTTETPPSVFCFSSEWDAISKTFLE